VRPDRLGALLSAAGTTALLTLPFVVFKANRIVPGTPQALSDVLPAWAALSCYALLFAVAAVALCVANPRLRLFAALAGVVVVALAVAAAGNALTPPGNKVVRVAPGAAWWILSVCLGLLATDAITRLRPGPALRVLLLAAALGVALLALAHGTFDHLSIMREYAVNAARFAHEGARHVALAAGSLGAALVAGLPLGILCYRVQRLRAARDSRHRRGAGRGGTVPVLAAADRRQHGRGLEARAARHGRCGAGHGDDQRPGADPD
jgi:osmoprotectant transport system permease protein